ncbi:hypothetical protein LSUB1_G000566 [Lachnellula subtilissima]|uniref:Uncharacterized protein n=1 Tax=Lachnellula subtilissima TaxID=602034 RepID=A0A8H8UEN5_9HELO|nr:hypothetical protein LSUB1_G000566 [Lachnellula subtilissima]
MEDIREDFDNLVWDKIDEEWEKVQLELLRRPIPCFAQFPEEKTLIEAATASHIEKRTQISTAPVLSTERILS